MNPGPLAPEARIIPLDQAAIYNNNTDDHSSPSAAERRKGDAQVARLLRPSQGASRGNRSHSKSKNTQKNDEDDDSNNY